MHRLSKPDLPENWQQSVATFQKTDPCDEGLSENIRWTRFADAFRELVACAREILANNQHGLCAYCECETAPSQRQIEHVIPKSASSAANDYTLDFGNMVMCCLGGTAKTPATAGETKRQRRQNHSCGEAKGNTELPFSPYHLPSFPLFEPRSMSSKEVAFQADNEACQRAHIPAADVERTIELLNLNCPRLKRARYAVWACIEDDILNIVCDASLDESGRDLLLQELVTRHSQMDKEYATTALLCLQHWLPKLCPKQ